MRVRNLFAPHEEISLHSYLKKCHIDTERYLKFNTVESPSNYPNIHRAVEAINKTKGDFVYVLTDSDP